MFGNIVTDGRGPIHGPGSPSTESRSFLYTSSISSLGGSYGGSGGESADCGGTYFSLTASQVVYFLSILLLTLDLFISVCRLVTYLFCQIFPCH